MTWTLDNSGTQSATIGTEHVLATNTNNGTFYFQARGNNLVNGDIVELRIYTMTLAGGTLELTWKSTFGPSPPACFVFASPPQPSDISIKFTLKQIAGTGRSWDWKVLRV